MLRYILDTDHFTLYEQGHPPLGQRLAKEPAGTVGLCAVTVQEALQGRLGALNGAKDGAARVLCYTWLVGTVQVLAQFPIVPFDTAAEQEYQHLRSLKLKVGAQDLKIGAIALVQQLIIVTRNKHDFSRIPGLVIEDWSV